MRALAAFLVVVTPALFAATSAAAYTHTGNTYFLVTGDFCIGCHSTSAVPSPTINVTQVTPDPLTVGGSAVFQVKLTSGRADPSSSFAGFAAGVDNKAGTFKASTDAGHEQELCTGGGVTACPASGGKTFTAMRDVTLRPWESDGTYTWQVELDDLGPGTFTLFVGGNDANGDGTIAGDHNGHSKLSFTVPGGAGEGEGGEGEGAAGEGEGAAGGEGEGEGTPPPQGCSATTTGHAVPLPGVAALGALALIGGRGVSRRR